jgi:hypothetical protein
VAAMHKQASKERAGGVRRGDTEEFESITAAAAAAAAAAPWN